MFRISPPLGRRIAYFWNPRHQIFIGLLAGSLALLFGSFLREDGIAQWQRYLFTVIALQQVFVLLRCWFLGLDVREGGVIVKNWTRNQQIEWQDIAAIEFTKKYRWHLQQSLTFRRKAGGTVYSAVFVKGIFQAPTTHADVRNRLEQQLLESRHLV